MKSQSAFSLVEALMALVIIGILLSMSIPLAQNFFLKSKSEVIKLELLQSIALARTESHARHAAVALCKSDNQSSCSGNWADGQLVFLDEKEDGVVHDKTQIIQVIKNKSHGKIFWRSYPSYRDYLHFSPTGLLGNDNGTFWYCHAKKSSPVWAIILSKSGRTRVEYPDKNGEIKDGQGKLLSCI